TVTLNRPQALNAFTLDMYRRFDPMLRGWAEDPAIKAVLIRGAGERAFCAGGDVRAIYEAGRGLSGDHSLTAAFFREEYELIGRYLGLSGVRVGAADALYCRFATHYAPRERVPALVAALTGSGGVEETLAGFAADPGPAPIRARQPAIDRCFAGDTVEAILDA